MIYTPYTSSGVDELVDEALHQRPDDPLILELAYRLLLAEDDLGLLWAVMRRALNALDNVVDTYVTVELRTILEEAL